MTISLLISVSKNVSFTQLLKALLQLASIYACGVLSAYGYNRIMINVANGTLKRIRDDMFTHMQSLPIKYFDRNAHGDLMSHYTNDIDSLRQMLSQTLPQVLNAVISILSVFISMLLLSPTINCYYFNHGIYYGTCFKLCSHSKC